MATDAGSKKLTASQRRAARRTRRNRRRRLTKIAAFAAVATVALLFIVSLFAGSLPVSLGSQGADGPGERFSDQGRTHLQERGESHGEYNSVPATSGWHYSDSGAPAPWGAYSEPLPDEVLVHNLEHGGVGIHYDCPDGCEELVGKLRPLASRVRKTIVSPYEGMDTTIALTAWNFLEKLDEYDEQRIADFIEAHVSSPNAPEYFAR